MLLVADSGSTKTQWIAENRARYETIGFNPFFHNTESILAELHKNEQLFAHKSDISEIHFYGAGCHDDEKKNIVRAALAGFFQKARIHVGHDMEAAAFATYVGKPTLSCILGTGSNICLFDGTEYSQVIPNLGYILGDEGSGGWFGKRIVTMYFYKQLPQTTLDFITEKYRLDRSEVINRIYKQPHPNVYLASFAKVLDEAPDKEFMNELKREGIRHFFKTQVLAFPDYQQYPVSFVGSIAFYLQDSIREVAQEFGCEVGVILKEPIERLFEWHVKI